MGGKLGKLPKKFHPKTLKFSSYLNADELSVSPPPKTYWEYKIPDDAWQMFGNDTIGDCTCAAIAHMLMLTTAHTGKIIIPTLKDVVGVYSAVTGYDPSQEQPDGSNPTDNGAAITDILNYWQTTGIAGHKILGWAEIDQTNMNHVHLGVYLFGAVDIGLKFPNSAMDQFDAGQAWEVVPNSSVDGGHCVPVFGYGSMGLTCVSWAKRQAMGNGFFETFCDEGYVVVDPTWINEASGLAPNHFNLDALNADLKKIAAAA